MIAARNVELVLEAEPTLAFRRDLLRAFPDAKLYLVGGAVRDALIGRPCKDFDLVVTNLPADRLESWLQKHGTVDLAGRDFAVFKFIPTGAGRRFSEPVDIALPRSEQSLTDRQGGYRDFSVSADPGITIDTDLARRDFTINAVAYDINERRLVDPHDGLPDLEGHRIRAVGEPSARFAEDLSRILRAVRFSAQLGFDIEPNTQAAMRGLAPRLVETRPDDDGKSEFVVPRETIGKELGKAFQADAARALAHMKELRILATLLPEIPGTVSLPERRLTPTAALAIILKDIPPETTPSIVRRLGLHTIPHRDPSHVDPADVAWTLKKLSALNGAAAQAMSGVEFERTFMSRRGLALVEVLEALEHEDLLTPVRTRLTAISTVWGAKPGEKIPPLVNGDDVVALSVPPGVRVRELLDHIRSRQLDGELRTKSDAQKALKKDISSAS